MSKLREIIAAQPAGLKKKDVEIFGVKLQMRQLIYAEMLAIRKRREEHPDDAENPIDWVIACAVDPETGEQVFSDTPEDRRMMRAWPMADLLRLSNLASEINSSDYKDVEKNSGASPS